MQLPIFFIEKAGAVNEMLVLDEDTSKHVVQVLRMQRKELLQLTDGQGNLITAEIVDAHKKKTTVRITHAQFIPRPQRSTCIAISLLKNGNRFEWFLEKATELGIHQIIPLLCERTNRQHFRYERMQSLLVSAMLQSQQSWLPDFHEPVRFNKFVQEVEASQKFIAHCIDEENKKHLRELIDPSLNGVVLIGPEGDFTKEEIELAMQHQFTPVSLGETRLRTETAGIVAATFLAS
jgi:16S rRNA (uracil1498-N3)-methyltransferase